MVEVIPAIIPETFEELRATMARVRGIVPLVQVDIMDGTYAPARTWPYLDKIDPDFKKILSQEVGMPFWEDVGFEVDLMVERPERIIPDWISAGAESVIIHLETVDRIHHIVEQCRKADVKVGMALKPSTPTDSLDKYIGQVDFVQFMGNDNIGHHGVDFDPAVLDKIRKFKKKYPDVPAGVDIGVNFETAPEIIRAGAARLVSGSTILMSENPREAVSQLAGGDVVE